MAGSSGLYQSLLSHARPVSKACDFDSLFTWLWFWLWWLAPCFTQPHAATVTTWWKSLTSPPRAWNNNNKQLIKARWEKVGEKTFVHLLSSWIHIQNLGAMLHFKKLLNVQQICYKGQTQTREPEKNEEQKPSAGLSTNTESEESRSTRTTAQQSVDEHIKHLSSLCQHTPVTVWGASLQPRDWLMSFPVRLLIGSLQNCCRIL